MSKKIKENVRTLKKNKKKRKNKTNTDYQRKLK